MKYLFIILAIFSNTAYANELYYYSVHPQFLDEKILVCDEYVRNNADVFKKDVNDLLKAYASANSQYAQKLLSKYGDNILNNTYIKSILDCGSDYKFSNGVNYYRELFTSASLFLSTIQHSLDSQTNRTDSIQEHHEYTIHYLNVILSSTNKTANKSLNRIGAKDAPPG